MIELVEVTKRFPVRPAFGRAPESVTALRAVSLSLPAGQVWAVVGPNGAGKSTLFGIALGFLRPSAGLARIGGAEPRRWLRRNGASYLPDRLTLPDAWPVSHALAGFARLDGLGDQVPRVVEAALDRFDLRAVADRPVGTLSRGLLQRVGLAQALLAARELIVLDEPMQGLDPLWRVRFRDILRELRGTGATVLLASHDIAEVERVADRVVVLRDGRVVEILAAAAPADAQAWTIRLHESSDAMAAAFPDARPVPGEDLAWVVRVADPLELSRRLAALLAAGAVLAGVTPATDSLEHRVRRTLGPRRDA